MQEQIEVFENDIALNLQLFCEENNIDDIRKESQAVWNSALYYIYKHVFKGTDKLKSKRLYNTGTEIVQSTYNAYNYDLVLEILDYYVYEMCLKADKEVSIIGFSILSGIPQGVIYEWGNGSTKLSNSSREVYEKLHEMRQESLSNKLVSCKGNPVGLLGVLNRHYGWNMGQPRGQESRSRALTAADLPRLGASATVDIVDNVQDFSSENK